MKKSKIFIAALDGVLWDDHLLRRRPFIDQVNPKCANTRYVLETQEDAISGINAQYIQGYRTRTSLWENNLTIDNAV